MHKREVRPKTTDHTGMECINMRYSPKLLIKWKSFGQFWMHLFQIIVFPQGTLLLQWCKHLSQPENALQYSSSGIFNSGFTPLEMPWTEKTFSLPVHLSRWGKIWQLQVQGQNCMVYGAGFGLLSIKTHSYGPCFVGTGRGGRRCSGWWWLDTDHWSPVGKTVSK